MYCDKLAPWNLKKTDTKRMNEVLSLLVEIIRRSSLLLFPVMPDSINKIYSILDNNNRKNFLKSYEKNKFSTSCLFQYFLK